MPGCQERRRVAAGVVGHVRVRRALVHFTDGDGGARHDAVGVADRADNRARGDLRADRRGPGQRRHGHQGRCEDASRRHSSFSLRPRVGIASLESNLREPAIGAAEVKTGERTAVRRQRRLNSTAVRHGETEERRNGALLVFVFLFLIFFDSQVFSVPSFLRSSLFKQPFQAASLSPSSPFSPLTVLARGPGIVIARACARRKTGLSRCGGTSFAPASTMSCACSRTVFAALLVLAVTATTLRAQESDVPAPEAWVALERGEHAKAASIFREELDRSPRNAVAALRRGLRRAAARPHRRGDRVAEARGRVQPEVRPGDGHALAGRVSGGGSRSGVANDREGGRARAARSRRSRSSSKSGAPSRRCTSGSSSAPASASACCSKGRPKKPSAIGSRRCWSPSTGASARR